MHNDKNLKLITLLIIPLVILCSYLIIDAGAGKKFNIIIGWIGFAVMVWCTISLKIYTGSYFSLVYLFEVGYYIITQGQSFLTAFMIPMNSTHNLYWSENAYDVNRSYLFSILCLICMHYGMLCANKRIHWNKITKIRKTTDYTNSMITIGLLLFPFALISYSVKALQIIRTYLSSGYAAAYVSISGKTSWNKIFYMVGDYFPFILFLLLAAYKDNKYKQRIIKGFIIGISLFNFAVGNRSEPICYILALLWFNKTTAVTKFKRTSNTIIFILLGILLVLIIPIIGETRNIGELNLDVVVKSFTVENSIIQVIIDTIIDMGFVAFPLVKTMQLIPASVPFHYGQSYFFALLSVFPNLLGGVHISVKHAALAGWLKQILNMNYGPGFSIPAEAYYNFGMFGFAIMPILGFFIGKLLNESNTGKELSAMRLFVQMGSFIVLFTVSRRDMLTAVRNSVYYVGLLYFAVYLAKKYGSRRRALASPEHNDRGSGSATGNEL